MPFPNLPVSKHFFAGGTSPREKIITDENTGINSTIYEDCNKELPSAEYFKINNLIKAGVTLEEVNTKVISETNPIIINNELNETVEKIKTKSSKNSEKENE